MKKIWQNKLGFGRAFVFFVIAAILGLTIYFWREYFLKITEPWIEESKKDGIISYVIGIKGEVDEVMNKSDAKNRRALELAEGTRRISDKPNLYSLELPEGWQVVSSDGARGIQLSKMEVQNNFFSSKVEDKKTYYISGSKFSVVVERGGDIQKNNHGKIVETKDLQADRMNGKYHVFEDANFPGARFLDFHTTKNGKLFIFTLSFNPGNYSDGEFTFQEILNSTELK